MMSGWWAMLIRQDPETTDQGPQSKRVDVWGPSWGWENWKD